MRREVAVEPVRLVETCPVVHDVFARDDVEGWVSGMDLQTGRRLSYRGEDTVQPASVAKLALLVSVIRAADGDALRLDDHMDIGAGPRTPGSTGLSVLTDVARLSVRDVATLMINVSDNHATDLLFQLVPPHAVTATMHHLGLPGTEVNGTVSAMFERLVPEDDGRTSVVDPASSPWRTTPTDMTRLLHLIWTDQAASMAGCNEVRRIMRTQAIKRFAAGFSDDPGVTGIASKSGTLLGYRNEAGVVEYNDASAYAVAVFTHTDSESYHDAAAESAIADAARAAVNHLREACGCHPPGQSRQP